MAARLEITAEAMSIITTSPAGGNQIPGDTTPPLPPAGLILTNGRLDWTSNSEPDIQDYRIFKSTTSANDGYSLLDTVVAPINTYQDVSFNSGGSQWYKITARDNAGNESDFSSVVSHVTSGGGVSADWVARSTAAGVIYAENDWSAATIDAGTRDDEGNVFPDAIFVSQDTSLKCSGSGSLRHDILKTEGQQSGLMKCIFPQNFATGDTFYVQYRQYFPEYYATHAFAGTQFGGPNAGGWKQIIISEQAQSNRNFEIVLQNTDHYGICQGYNINSTGSFAGWETTLAGAGANVLQNQINRGYGNATNLEKQRTYGGVHGIDGNNAGTPSDQTGAFIYYPDEWLTFYLKIQVGGFGTGVEDTRIEYWAARNGGDYLKLCDVNVALGIESGDPNQFNTVWLTSYNTNRLADPSREDTFTLYDEVIVSTQPIAAPTAVRPTWLPAADTIAAVGQNNFDTIATADIAGKNHSAGANTVFDDFSGGTLVYQRGAPYLAVTGGGHGSSVNLVALWGPITGENPKWKILVESTDSPLAQTSTQGRPEYPWQTDGKPTAFHSGNMLIGDPNGPYMWATCLDNLWEDANGANDLARLDVDIGEWDSEDTYPDVPRGSAIEGAAAIRADGTIFYFGASNSSGHHCVYNGSVWTQEGLAPNFFDDVGAIYDPVNDNAWAFGPRSNDGVPTWVTMEADGTLTQGTTSGSIDFTSKSLAYDSSRGVAWSPIQASRTMQYITPGTNVWQTRTFQGATPPNGVGTNPGHYGRFQYVAELDILIFAPEHDDFVYAINLDT